ncbi:SDR family NAD(P)-dependent oxidoreductase [Candidatus Saccharibacteria bacterium]|nr:SDR family NAD(P)-dependent oxidoreductase [Candidatus Saccharibacteria bacterium]
MSSKTSFDPSRGAALITGGSSGIGLAFSRELAARGYDLIIASRDNGKLTEAAADLQKEFGVKVEAIRLDLADRANVEKLVERITDKERPVDVVVNNAGFALHNSLLDTDTSLQESAMEVMATAVLILSGAAARTMKQRSHGAIINVSSQSAWLFAGNYSAIKRWVVIYTESLALELANTGVRTTAVCPGWVKTGFHATGGVNRPNIPKWVWIEPEEVVRTALRAIDRGQVVSVPTLRWRVIIFFTRHFRWLSRKISRKLISRRIKELDERDDRE